MSDHIQASDIKWFLDLSWIPTIREEEILAVCFKRLALLTQRKLQNAPAVFTNIVLTTVLDEVIRVNRQKTMRLQYASGFHSTKQLLCQCLEIRDIKAMKSIKCPTACFQVKKT